MTYESPVIRPPSEWQSGLLRVTRGCNWNRCRFCGLYTHFGQSEFSERTLAEVLADLNILHSRRPAISTLFLGDADPLAVDTRTIVTIVERARQIFQLERITSYARFSTLYKLGSENLTTLAKAGLDRVHVGLESGDESILRFQRKGQSTKMIQTAAGWLQQAGIELSVYVLLGLGGSPHWRQHINNTAKLLNDIRPQFIRLRRLWIYPATTHTGPPCPLTEQVADGTFVEQNPEGTVRELALLLTQISEMDCLFTCDHSNNYLNVSGNLATDKDVMQEEVATFLELPAVVREQHYQEVNSRI